MAMAEYSNPPNEAGATGVANTVSPVPLVGTGIRHDAAPAVQPIELLT